MFFSFSTASLRFRLALFAIWPLQFLPKTIRIRSTMIMLRVFGIKIKKQKKQI